MASKVVVWGTRREDMDQGRYEEALRSLIEICSGFFEQLGRAALIQRIVSAGIQLTDGDRGSLFLADDLGEGRSHRLKSMIATGMKGEEITVDASQGVVGHVFRNQTPLIINDAQNDPLFYRQVDQHTHYETKTILCVPLRTRSGKSLGVIEILNAKDGKFEEQDLQILQILALFAAVALEQTHTIETLQAANMTLKQEKDAWLKEQDTFRLFSNHPELNELYSRLPVFAESDSSILIQGESGTGKEVIAKTIHSQSQRRSKPFVAINCAAIPESLFEAELFGVTKGAATGTIARKGKFEMADGGTLFLDEIGELPLSMQAKLLRVLQEKTVSPIGSDDSPLNVDFRLIAATNRDLAKGSTSGEFREDLFYRINVVQFRLAPLRERTEDIPQIVSEILNRFEKERGWKRKLLTEAAYSRLKSYSWPGNIRQLQNKLEAAVISSGQRPQIEESDFQFEKEEALSTESSKPVLPEVEAPENLNLREAKHRLEREMIQKALDKTGGNRTHAAKLLGISREGLRKAQAKLAR